MSAIDEIVAERSRQIEQGNTPAHDDTSHQRGELAKAAASYCLGHRGHWPWDDFWWKPKSRRFDLIRAGALIVAEIERLDRLSRVTELAGAFSPAVAKALKVFNEKVAAQRAMAAQPAAPRDAIVEECARVCDDYKRDGLLTKTYATETADELAARIRALKGGAA